MSRRRRNKQNQRRGNASEKAAQLQLEVWGFAQIENIETGWKRVATVDLTRFLSAFPYLLRRVGGSAAAAKSRGLQAALIFPHRPVQGDIRAIEPGTGRAVLVEVKDRPNRLVFSDFEEHQIEALRATREANGLALVCWFSRIGMHWLLFDPELAPFRPRTGISVDDARAREWEPREIGV